MFGKGFEALTKQDEQVSENREKLMDYCMENGILIMNTYFKKSSKCYCTSKEMETDGFKAPWTPDRFCMLDYCHAPRRWRNVIEHVTALPQICY